MLRHSDSLPQTMFRRHPVRMPCPDIFYSLHSRFAYDKGLQSFGSSCSWAFHCFAMDSKELSSITDCFGDKKAIKTPKLNTIWLELITRVLNMLIGLKYDNYYSKVFIRVNYKLWNNTFWVVISGWELCMNRWNPYIRTTLMNWWSCLRVKEHWRINGYWKWSLNQIDHNQGTMLDWLWRVLVRKKTLTLKRFSCPWLRCLQSELC